MAGQREQRAHGRGPLRDDADAQRRTPISETHESEHGRRDAEDARAWAGGESRGDEGAAPEGPLSRGAGLFAGRFVVGRCLGAGGTGTVYEGYDKLRQETIALKVLNQMDAESIYSIKEEFRALSDVVDPNLVGLHELFAEEDQWFFTMELIQGKDFLEHLRVDAAETAETAGRPFREAALRDVLRQLVSGVSAIHRGGKLHRDLKPSNVMVTPEGRVVILDFGLVCESAAQDPDRIAGTPAYMSPEQACGQEVTTASDWYAVGAMLFEALTGKRAFEGPVLVAVANKLTKEAPRPGASIGELPADLERLCSALLSRDPSRRPIGAELRRAVGLAATDSVRSSFLPQSLASSEFVGRARELTELRDAYAMMLEGRPVLGLIAGASGMGKSALARHFLSTFEQARAPLIFSGRCFERESVPYKGVDSLVDELGLYLNRLTDADVDALIEQDTSDLLRAFPVLRGVRSVARRARSPEDTPDVQEARRRAFRSLKDVLRNLSLTRPLVLFIDDLQWADLDSARLLVDLLAPPRPPSMLVLAAYRSTDGGHTAWLRELRERATGARDARDALHAVEVALGPLSGEEGRRLASRLLVSDEDAGLDSHARVIAAEAGGNPFFIEALARYPGTEGWAVKGPTLDRIILEHLEGEPESARRLLSVVAVAGQPIEEDVALEAAGIGDGARSALASLRVGRFIRTARNGDHNLVEAYHDKIRESVFASLGDADSRHCHARLAAALEATGRAEPDLLARQFHGARDRPKAHHYAKVAADLAARALAFDRAAELYGLAIECAPDGQSTVELRRKKGDSLGSAGRCALAAQPYLEAAELAAPEAAFDLRRQAASQLFTAGHFDAALRILKPLLREAGVVLPESPFAVRAKIAAALVRLGLRGARFEERSERDVPKDLLRRIDAARSASDGLASTDPIRAASMMLEATLLSLEAGEPRRVAWALSQYGLLLGAGGKAERRRIGRSPRGLIERAAVLAERIDAPDARAVVRLSRAKLSLCLGRWREAVRHADECSSYARSECVGGWGNVTVANNIALYALQVSGEFSAMGERAGRHLREAVEIGDLYAEVTTMIYTGVAELVAGDVASARSRVDAALARWQQQDFLFQNWLAVQAQSLCDLHEGRPGQAWERLERAWPRMAARQLLQLSVVSPFALKLRGNVAIACASARPAEKRRFLRSARADARALEDFGRPDSVATSKALDAALAILEENRAAARVLLSDAAELYARADMPLESASAHAGAGRLLGGEEGRTVVASAHAELASRGVKDPGVWGTMFVAAVGLVK